MKKCHTNYQVRAFFFSKVILPNFTVASITSSRLKSKCHITEVIQKLVRNGTVVAVTPTLRETVPKANKTQ